MGPFTTFLQSIVYILVFASHGKAANVEPLHESLARDQAWPDNSDRVLTVSFNEHEEYKNLSHEYDHMWDDLLPLNGGFLRKRYANGQIHGHGISMFHQLHCLQIMRAAYQEMEEKVEGMHHDRREVQEEKPHMHMHLGKGHWLHCFDYLRQAILCNADATVETPSVSSKGKPVVDGMIERKCRDWKALWEAAVNSDRIPDIL